MQSSPKILARTTTAVSLAVRFPLFHPAQQFSLALFQADSPSGPVSALLWGLKQCAAFAVKETGAYNLARHVTQIAFVICSGGCASVSLCCAGLQGGQSCWANTLPCFRINSWVSMMEASFLSCLFGPFSLGLCLVIVDTALSCTICSLSLSVYFRRCCHPCICHLSSRRRWHQACTLPLIGPRALQSSKVRCFSVGGKGFKVH